MHNNYYLVKYNTNFLSSPVILIVSLLRLSHHFPIPRQDSSAFVKDLSDL